jgi:hypothetical protein
MFENAFCERLAQAAVYGSPVVHEFGIIEPDPRA